MPEWIITLWNWIVNIDAEWAMVIITAIYVVATICIMRANQKAANAAKAQLKETQQQFYAINRPHVSVEVIFERKCYWGLRFTNHGNQTAFHTILQFDPAFIESLPQDSFRQMVQDATKKSFVLGINQHYDLYIGSHEYGHSTRHPIVGSVTYTGYDDAIYSEDFNIDMGNYATVYSLKTSEEDLMERLDKQNKLLEQTNQLLSCIVNKLPDKEEENE